MQSKSHKTPFSSLWMRAGLALALLLALFSSTFAAPAAAQSAPQAAPHKAPQAASGAFDPARPLAPQAASPAAGEWAALGAGLSGKPASLFVFGNDLYAGGTFNNAGGDPEADGFARWDGTAWSSVGSMSFNGIVYSIQAIGGDLYVGGSFTDLGGDPNIDYVAKWDGAAWSAVGASPNAWVYKMAVIGSDLYIAGAFTDLGGDPTADYVAKWNGSAWSGLGGGLNNYAYALEAVGTDLYVGGMFTNAGGDANANLIARWDGSAWSPLGTGISGSTVFSITAYGADVYVGGVFTSAGGAAGTQNIAKWNGSAWSALGAGLNNRVDTIALNGSKVYVGGTFTDVNGDPDNNYLMQWDGAAWRPLSSTPLNGSTYRLLRVGNSLYASGVFSNAGGDPNANYVAELGLPAPDRWASLGTEHVESTVFAIAASGKDVYAGGGFPNIGGDPNKAYLAKWDGSAWQALGSTPLNDRVTAVAVSGKNVYAGGRFTNAGGSGANYFARWDGSAWSDVGASALNGSVTAVAVSGKDVYIGGWFSNVGGVDDTYGIAKWDGSAWSALGGGLNNKVSAILVNGRDVYAGGLFTDAGGDPNADYVAKWDGSAWSALGVTPLNNEVEAIAVSGTNVYVGGKFDNVGGNADFNWLAKWNGVAGSDWAALPSAPLDGAVHALVTDGYNLYVGHGRTDDMGPEPVYDLITKWDGSAWSSFTSTHLNNPVLAIALSGTDVYAGGYFFNAGGVSDADYIAKFTYAPAVAPVITWADPADIATGTALGATQLNATANTPGTFTYTPAAGTVLALGAHTLHVDFVPDDTVNYTNASKDVSINVVSQATPVITWADPADIFYGTALSATQLNATANTPGIFTYTPAAGEILSVGAHTLHVDFSPSDGVHYTTASKDVNINVLESTAPFVTSITRANPSPTNQASIDFVVTFSEPVSGLDVVGPDFDDFSLAVNLLTGAKVSAVNGSGASYTVTVDTGSGNGTLRLDAVTAGHIVDTAGNPLVSGYSAGQTYSVVKTATFGDVPLNHWAGGFIERLYIAQVTGGCSTSPLAYCPDQVITRAQLAVFLLRGRYGAGWLPPAVGSETGYNDVPVTHWAAAWIKQFATEGITSGCGNGNFCPNTVVTRDQMAIFLLRARHGATYTPPAATGVFVDVPTSHWAAAWIEQLAAEGITSGCGGGAYCPSDPVTRAQMAVFIVKVFNLP